MRDVTGRIKLIVLLFIVVTLSEVAPARASDFAFEFNTDGVLPSSQGAGYTPHIGNSTESAVFSVSSGLLHQNSGGGGWYDSPIAFEHQYDATLEWRTKVFHTDTLYRHFVQLFDTDPNNLREWPFLFTENGIYGYDGSLLLAVDTTDAFHTYRLLIPGGSDSYQFFLDGQLAFSGLAHVQPNSTYPFKGRFIWGDGLVQMDWDYLRFTNHAPTNAVPEPAFVQLGCLLAYGVGYAFLRCRRR